MEVKMLVIETQMELDIQAKHQVISHQIIIQHIQLQQMQEQVVHQYQEQWEYHNL